MPYTEGSLTVADVAAELGMPADPRMASCTDAARTWAERRASHIPADELWWNPAIHRGGVLYASAEYQSRVTPEGMAGYDPDTGMAVSNTSTLFYRARCLVPMAAVIA